MTNLHPRIEKAIISLLQPYELHFYFFFLQRIQFLDWTNKIPTMCATVVGMRLTICYNVNFVEELNDNELRFLLLHELKHHLLHHLERGKSFHPEKANIAMDMIINHLIVTHYHKMRNGFVISEMPVFTQEKCQEMIAKVKSLRELSVKEEQEIMALVGKPTGCVLDPNYKGELAFEPLYHWLMEEHDKSKTGESHQLSPDTKTMLDNADIRDMMMDVHIKLDEVGEDIKKQLVEDSVAKARLEVTKTRGSVPGDVEEVLKLLLKAPRKNNIKILKRSLSAIKGRTKERTWKKQNRRLEGIKGRFGTANQINAGLDVSGSMWGTFDIVLSEIFKDGYEVNLVQIDTQVQKVEKITNKNQLKNFKMKGGGGTCLQPFVDHVMDKKNKLSKYATVLLTDGYCDHLDFKGSRQQFLILTTGDLVQYKNGPCVRQIKIENVN